MHIKITEEISNKIDKIVATSYWNVAIDKYLYSNILKGVFFPHPQELYTDSKNFQDAMLEYTYYYNDDESLIGSALYSILNAVVENEEEQLPAEIMSLIIHNSKIMKKEDCDAFHKDPYIKNIKMDGVEYGSKSTQVFKVKPYNLFEYGDAPCYNGLFIPKIAMATHALRCPALSINNDEHWDEITPRTVELSKPYIQNARGDVLVLGGGLGYFAYMASLKRNVNSITIVERDEDVVELFKKSILPQFKYKDKIKIICADSVDYLKSIDDDEYDYCFADLWSWDESDSIYITVKSLCRKFKKMVIEYWLENDFLQTILSCVSEVLEVEYSELTGETLEFTSNYSEYEQFVFDYIIMLLENFHIRKPEDLDKIFKPENLRALLSS